MQILRCCNCGKIFDEPLEMQEHSDFWGAGGWTNYYVSPCCKEVFDVFDDEESEELEDAV